jgi:hypothetical protein
MKWSIMYGKAGKGSRRHARYRNHEIQILGIPKMLSVNLPDYDVAINRMFNDICNRFHMLDPILRLFPPKVIVHGGAYRQVSTPRILDTMLKDYRATIGAEPGMFLQTDADEFRDFLVSMITSLQEQQEAHTLEVISDTSKAVGTYVEGKDRNIWDVYIEMVEKLELQFDESGKPYSIGVPSALARKLTAVFPSEEQLQQMTHVVERRRHEYFANTRSRRLSMAAAESRF